MQVLLAKRKEENCTGRYSKGLRNQNKEHLCKSNNLMKQVWSLVMAMTIPSELAGTLFPVLKVQVI